MVACSAQVHACFGLIVPLQVLGCFVSWSGGLLVPSIVARQGYPFSSWDSSLDFSQGLDLPLEPSGSSTQPATLQLSHQAHSSDQPVTVQLRTALRGYLPVNEQRSSR